ncbi:Triose-phosphate transporter domain [Macleaya cordata]|uniref:Probable purine permease n=1 Tax=Macleaya cordata TaxID=56857 RepID=A0A200PW86_MACCD|nr:Triose-phosphate transporter domain [Macleaya cordata]
MSEVDMLESQGLNSPKDATVTNDKPTYLGVKRWQWWFHVTLYTLFMISGETSGVLLGKFYYDQGGNSIWMLALIRSAKLPLLLLVAFFFFFYLGPTHFRSSNLPDFQPTTKTSCITNLPGLISLQLGLLMAGFNMLYSCGLLYLPVSTCSIQSATKLAFHALFSYLLISNSQKFSPIRLNSIVLLTISASLLAVNTTTDIVDPTESSKTKYIIGFLSTLGASAIFSLWISLGMRFVSRVRTKRETISIPLEVVVFQPIVAICACLVGLYVSGEWDGLKGEVKKYAGGKVSSYVMTFVWMVGLALEAFGVVG